ncbi:hypothetical protein ACIP29_37560 [Streptomyces coelicoflavus]|uniref:hypothetical protein n=1 Tax=Bacteria TaxID=2 RepID=UPI00380ED1A2
MIALIYLLTVLVAVVALAVALRPRRVPTPPRPNPPALSGIEPGTEIRVILTAAAQLADRLAPAA